MRGRLKWGDCGGDEVSDVTLGKLLTGGEKRDAIHIAIAPVVAGQRLAPGVQVGFLEDSKSGRVGIDAEPIGIVDPFLLQSVEKGQRFYLFLFPGTVTSLRHDWTHPAFTEAVHVPDPDSEKWLRKYAVDHYSYAPDEEAAFTRLIENLKEQSLRFWGSDLAGLNDLDDADELRHHAERYLGIRIDWGSFSFSCSC